MLRKEDQTNKQLVDSVQTLDIEQNLIILPNVGLNDHMIMT